ncbi:MAG: TadE/TadG family type IV pilus assembly protein [Anaerolineae bacterium]
MVRGRFLERGRAGQTLAEFAIVVLIFILLVVGIVDISRGVYTYNMLKSAAREGARYGTFHPYDEEGIERAAKALVVGLDVDRIRVETDPCECSTIEVAVEYDFYPVTAIAARSFYEGQGVRLRAVSKMRAEVPVYDE